jgi:ribosome-binding protein aMBF1 (putative translation factor)
MFKFIERWLNKNGFYKYADLQAGGHCGLCGKWVAHEILPKGWAITVCKECLEEKCEVDYEGNVSRKTVFE